MIRPCLADKDESRYMNKNFNEMDISPQRSKGQNYTLKLCLIEGRNYCGIHRGQNFFIEEKHVLGINACISSQIYS
jgi:hypothetical protein